MSDLCPFSLEIRKETFLNVDAQFSGSTHRSSARRYRGASLVVHGQREGGSGSKVRNISKRMHVVALTVSPPATSHRPLISLSKKRSYLKGQIRRHSGTLLHICSDMRDVGWREKSNAIIGSERA